MRKKTALIDKSKKGAEKNTLDCTWSWSQSPFLLRFNHGQILVQHSQAQTYGILFTILYVEHQTEKQFEPFLKSLL